MNTSSDYSWARVLVVDDEAAVRFTLRAILEDEGIQVEEAKDGLAAVARLEAGDIDLVISDLKMPRMDGMQLLKRVPHLPGSAGVIMVTAHGSERHAVEAMQKGAIDYFSKPFEPLEIVRVVFGSLERVALRNENAALRGALLLSAHMVFDSPEMLAVARLVERVSAKDVSVLITGESGTGKELVARAIARGSTRSNAPFVTFNCAAIARDLAEAELFGHTKGAFTGAQSARRGLFREADGGTLLLDEIGELDLDVQASLLRVIQEREVRPVGQDRSESVDIRLIATTHRDLESEAVAGRFRHDLFYRLSVVEIHLPALRERVSDVRRLAEHFAEQAAQRFGMQPVRLSENTIRALESHPWPGNVRQLQNVVERMVALSEGPVIDEHPFDGRAEESSDLTLPEQVGRFEREVVARMLRQTEGNQSEAARRLGVSRSTLIEKLKRYGLI